MIAPAVALTASNAATPMASKIRRRLKSLPPGKFNTYTFGFLPRSVLGLTTLAPSLGCEADAVLDSSMQPRAERKWIYKGCTDQEPVAAATTEDLGHIEGAGQSIYTRQPRLELGRAL